MSKENDVIEGGSLSLVLPLIPESTSFARICALASGLLRTITKQYRFSASTIEAIAKLLCSWEKRETFHSELLELIQTQTFCPPETAYPQDWYVGILHKSEGEPCRLHPPEFSIAENPQVPDFIRAPEGLSRTYRAAVSKINFIPGDSLIPFSIEVSPITVLGPANATNVDTSEFPAVTMLFVFHLPQMPALAAAASSTFMSCANILGFPTKEILAYLRFRTEIKTFRTLGNIDDTNFTEMLEKTTTSLADVANLEEGVRFDKVFREYSSALHQRACREVQAVVFGEAGNILRKGSLGDVMPPPS